MASDPVKAANPAARPPTPGSTRSFERWRSSGASRFGRALPTGSLIGFISAILAIGVIALFSYRSLNDRSEAVEATNHTLQMAKRLEALLGTLTDAETGQRGFLLTEDEHYLEPYEKARAALPGQLEEIRRLARGNTAQEQKLEAVASMARQKMEELRSTIEVRRKSGLEAAIALVDTDQGKIAMDRLRAAITAMEDQESTVLEAHSRAWQDAARYSSAVTWAGAALLFFLIGLSAFLSSRDFRTQQIEVWLREGQTELGRRVAGEQSTGSLGTNVLAFLAAYLDAQVGAMHVAEPGGTFLRVAGHALPPASGASGSLRRGEGLAGQAVAENRVLHLRDVPEGYLPITSSLGQARSRELLIAPATADGAVNAVIELGFLHPTHPTDLELLRRVAEPIGVALRSSRYRTQLEELLEETQRQAEALQTQQEEVRVANEELEEQSRVLRESQSRLEQQQTELEQTNVQLEEQTQILTHQKDRLAGAHDELTAKTMELERASRYKSEFLANMSHELRTPLNSSLILAKLLADNKGENLTPEQVRFAQSIYSAGNDLLDIINDVLDLSKIEAGKMDVAPEVLRLPRLVETLTQTFRPLADQKGISFSATLDPGGPQSLETDAQRLQQILKNLLSNAFKFTERGEVSLRIFAAEGERVGFAIRDTGIGIPAPQQEVIFEAFRQADGTTNRKYGGTGLGLSISRDLARALGGEIRLESQPGRGSTFTLALPAAFQVDAARPEHVAPETPIATPVARAQPDPRQRSPDPRQRSPTPRQRSPDPRQRSVEVEDDREGLADDARVLLVIEDDAAFSTILFDLAHELGFRCLIAPGADEGFELAHRFRPAAIVLDMNLPDHSGLTVLDRLKRNSATRHIPVQVVSVEDYTQTALEMGAAGYTLKPVKREQLVAALSKLEAKSKQAIRSVLVVEDDLRQRESICHLLAAQDVRTVPVETAAQALEQLRATTHDCMVLDVSLPDASGFELLETMATGEHYAFPPVIIYTGRSLSSEEEQRLRRYSRSIIIKGARSPERLLDEVTLFLHQVEANLPPERRKMLAEARNREALFEDCNVLVVEDDVRNIFALSSVLEPKGARLTIARNGREALDALGREARIDIVLMDIMMPEMDGYEAMRELRKRPGLEKLPVIALTAKAMRDDQERCLEAGANDYIAKPIDVEKLLSLMRVWMPK